MTKPFVRERLIQAKALLGFLSDNYIAYTNMKMYINMIIMPPFEVPEGWGQNLLLNMHVYLQSTRWKHVVAFTNRANIVFVY